MLTGREHFYGRFAEAVGRLAAQPVVLDLGTTHRFRKELAPFAARFTGRYWAMDYRAPHSFGALNVDVEGDIQLLPFRDGCAGGVICLEVLEHVEDPARAVSEIHRVLAPGGLALVTVPFLQPYHGEPGYYRDLYRFTDDGLRHLFARFRDATVEPLGGVPYRTALGLRPQALRRLVVETAGGMALLNAVDRRWPTRNPMRWMVRADK